MKRYLIRTAVDPRIHYSAYDLADKGFIWSNSGNLIFQYAVMNVLGTEDTVFEPITDYDITDPKSIDKINETFDAVILPFADAFRESFRQGLIRYTDFIKKLTIPCHVIGIGLNAEYEPDFTQPRKFDEEVREFVSAVLEHTTQIGLRGELTGKYLETLGFIPEKHFTVIGCPSLYMHGSDINTRYPVKNPQKFATNINIRCSDQVEHFLERNLRFYENCDLIQQREAEFFDMYYGINGSKQITNLHKGLYRKLKAENRVKFFMNVPDWLDYMQGIDLFFGCRIHGTVAAVLGGVPSVFIPIDSRTRELAGYHGIATLEEEKLKDKSILTYLERLDFSAFGRLHENNLLHYIDFLRINGLSSILDEKLSWPYGTSPMEKSIFDAYEQETYPPVDSFAYVDAKEKFRRSGEAAKVLSKRLVKEFPGK